MPRHFQRQPSVGKGEIDNKKDFAEAKTFGLELFAPKEFLTKIGEGK